jgi:hypothetical protein
MKFIKRKNIDTYKPKSQRLSVEVDGRAIINTNKSLTVPKGTVADRPATGIPGMVRYNTEIHDFEIYTDFAPAWSWEKIKTNRPAKINIVQIGVGGGTGEIASISVLNGGSGYDPNNPPIVTISNPDIGDDNAVAVANVNLSGVITSIDVISPGTGYVDVPTATVSGSATFKVTLDGLLKFEIKDMTNNNFIPLDHLGNPSSTNIQVYVENVYQLPEVNYTIDVTGGLGYIKFDNPVPLGKPVYIIYGFDR